MIPPLLAPTPANPVSLISAPAPVAEVAQFQAREQQVDSKLRVSYDDVEILEGGRILVFTGKVVATYGTTILKGSRFVVDNEKKTAVMEGEASLEDPIGSVRATAISIDWENNSGSALMAKIVIGNARISAGKVEFSQGVWQLGSADITLSRVSKPPYRLTARTVTLRPGDRGVARHVHLEVLGSRLGPIPIYSFSLTKRAKSFSIPSITNSPENGLGVQWDGNLFLGESATIYLDLGFFPRTFPSLVATYSYSFLNPETASGNIRIPSELGEVAETSYLANIKVSSPQAEREAIATRRINISASTEWNRPTTARRPDSRSVSKLVDLAYENSGPIALGGYAFTARAQTIRPDGPSDWTTRFAVSSVLLPNRILLSPQVSAGLRFDSFSTLSEKGTFATVRAEANLVTAPNGGFTFAAGYTKGWEVGNRDFVFDSLPYSSFLTWRLDYQRGPTTFRLIQRYDLAEKRWFDRQYEIAWVAESWEPFIAYRQFPSNYQVGIRLRISNLADQLTQRPRR
ncbi:MAG: hypothetical protein MUC92_02670 [Fimbriimonadaceae bacterium]|nr:hypothetical protein [Fimbriimonadaceae bacterium]